MPCVVLTINLFSIQEIGHPKWRVALGFRQGLFEGFFRTACGSLRSRRQPPHPLASTNPPDLHSSNRLQRPAMRTHPHPEPPARGSPPRPCHWHRCQSVRRDRWSGVLRINRRTAGGLRSSRADRGAQVLPPAGATVPPWLPAKSAHVSNLPACCALGPPACAAPCSCHHEACSARSAWPHPGKACPSV